MTTGQVAFAGASGGIDLLTMGTGWHDPESELNVHVMASGSNGIGDPDIELKLNVRITRHPWGEPSSTIINHDSILGGPHEGGIPDCIEFDECYFDITPRAADLAATATLYYRWLPNGDWVELATYTEWSYLTCRR